MFEDIIGSGKLVDTRDLAKKIKLTSEEFIVRNDSRFSNVSERDIEISLDSLLKVHPEIERIFPIKMYNSISTYYDCEISKRDQKKKANFDKIIKFDFPYLLGGKQSDFNVLRLDLNMVFVYISYIVEDTVDDMWICRMAHSEERLYPHKSFIVE